jgi:hypothetical protein
MQSRRQQIYIYIYIYKIYTKEGDEVSTLRQLPLFMLTFERRQNIEDIYKIENILGLKVRIEPLRKISTLIPQCKKCQGFGHTLKYCYKQERCVKYAQWHSTSECNKKREEKPKCVNCGEAHPASYRGCLVVKRLQNKGISTAQTEEQHKKPERAQTRCPDRSHPGTIFQTKTK